MTRLLLPLLPLLLCLLSSRDAGAQTAGSRVLSASKLLSGKDYLPAPAQAVSGCKLSVVGAGYGGVYFAYRLVQDEKTVAPEDVCVFEASTSRIGGRVYTIRDLPQDKDLVVDVGGYRFVPSQKIISGLVQTRLGLGSKCYMPLTCEDSRRVVTDSAGLDNTGFITPVEVMLNSLVKAGVRVFYGYRLTSISDLAWQDLWEHTVPGQNRPVELKFENGGSAISRQVMLNIPSEAIARLHQLSILFTKGGALSGLAYSNPRTLSYTKVYAQYKDAWWITKLGMAEGEFKEQNEPLLAGRYHDGHARCFDGDGKQVHVGDYAQGGSCNGLLLVAYFGAKDLNQEKFYTQYQATDDPLTIIQNSGEDGNAELLQAVHNKLMAFHEENLKMKGYGIEDIDFPEYIYMANWKEENTLTGSIHDWPKYLAGTDYHEITKTLQRPIPGYDVFVANEAFGVSPGWAEGSLLMAERVLAHELGVSKPWWMDAAYYQTAVLDLEYFDLETVQIFSHNFPQSAAKSW